MSPSGDPHLFPPTTATRRVVLPPGVVQTPHGAVPRSEFEDFMNAYRPTLEVPKKEEVARSSASEDTKPDFGRSFKKLMKRNQSSPSFHKKTIKKESIQRVPPDREIGLANELKPMPTSTVKKASRPPSVHIDSSQPAPFHQKPSTSQPETPKTPVSKPPEVPPRNGSKSKVDRNSIIEEPQPPPMKVDVVPPLVLPIASASHHVPPKGSPSASMKRKLSGQDAQHKKETIVLVSTPPTPAERDCYCLFVAKNCLGRFLPSRWNPDPLLSLRLVEVPDRRYKLIFEFEELPELEKPKSSSSGLIAPTNDLDFRNGNWDQVQAFSWIKETKMAVQGLLLINVERCAEFPYVTYLVVHGTNSEVYQKVNQLRGRPLPVNHHQLHFVAGYDEAVTVSRPPIQTYPDRPSSDRSGYVVSLYQVLPGEDGLRFEQNWVTWTGARQLYSHAPEYMGLRRISIHKSVLPTHTVVYSMLCEFTHIMEHLTEACVLVDQLRARCCGFTGIYRVLDTL